MSGGDRNLVLWAGCVMQRDVLQRAEAVVAGGFSCMSILCGDLVAHERAGGSVRELSRDLQARGAPIPILDPFLAWYPGWGGTTMTGVQADSQNVDADTVLRYAEEVGARSLSVLTPFHGSPAPREEVLDALGAFADRAAAIDLRLHIEVIPTSMAPDLAAGWDMVKGVGRDNVGLVLDTFHLGRSGTTPEELSAIPADRVFHVQLCDAPREPRIADYFEEAVTIRDFAGDGELGIREMCRCLDDMGALGNVGPEVFGASLDAMSAEDVGRLCREKTDAFLASIHEQEGDLVDRRA
jgi:sugar phosphate isomerase/epimerase